MKRPEIDGFMDCVAERNRTALRLAKAAAAPLGNLCFIQASGEPMSIVADRVFIKLGQADHQRVTCHENRVTCCKTLSAHQPGNHTLNYLGGLGSDDWPRAQAAINTATKTFQVSRNKYLRSPQFEKQIPAHFHLTKDEASVTVDPKCAAIRFTLSPKRPQGTCAVTTAARKWKPKSLDNRISGSIHIE